MQGHEKHGVVTLCTLAFRILGTVHPSELVAIVRAGPWPEGVPSV